MVDGGEKSTSSLRSTSSIPSAGTLHQSPDNLFCVVRPSSDIFDSCFPASTYSAEHVKILNFVMHVGKPQSGRSDGYRIDFGCAGQAQNLDDYSRPKTLVGADIFEKHPDGILAREWFGRIVDRLCLCGDRVSSQKMLMPTHKNKKRYSEYAAELNRFLFGTNIFIEHVTVQLLCLTAGHSGKLHKDTMNDHRTSYNRCFVKVSMLPPRVFAKCDSHLTAAFSFCLSGNPSS
jgi:hypothetical protein